MDVNIRDFPQDIHKEAKLQAVREGISLKELFIKAVAEYVERANKKGGKA